MSKRTWYRMALDKGSTATSATIDIFDDIGYFGVTVKDFRDDLNALGDVEKITLRINSPGGEVFEAVAIFTLLQMHPAEVTVQVIGVAASSASFLAMVGDTIQIAENAYFMVHLPSTMAWGDEKELRKALTMLEKVRDQMVSAYSKRTGLDPEEVEDMMSEETWFSADEAVEAGLADEVIGAVSVTANFDARRFAGAVPAGAKKLFARRNQKESPMDPKGKKTAPVAEETAEEMEARIRAEVTAELKAAAEAEEEAKENDEDDDEADKAKAKKDSKTAEDSIRAEYAQIADACLIAGVPEKAAEYISAKKTLSQVMADLKKLAVDGLSNERTNAHNHGGFDQKRSGNIGNAEDLDVDAIYAKWNSPKRGPRAGRATN